VADGGGPRTDYRVRLLGEFERYTPDGALIEPQPNNRPRPEDARLLAMLVLHRVGQPIPEDDLLRAGWDHELGGRGDLQPALSRLRGAVSIYGKEGQLPIRLARVNRTYALELDRQDVDATYFIDRVEAGLSDDASELGHLCSLWRGNPFKIYGNVPDRVWLPLRQALDRFKTHLRTRQSLAHRIADWERFWSLWDDRPAAGPRILIVDDDHSFVESLQRILTGFSCECAYTVDQALLVIATHDQDPFHAAIVDLHLTEDGTDGLGVTVLEEMARSTPDVPRLLLTRNPLDKSQLEVVRRFGLFDVYKKQTLATTAAPEMRTVVDRMVNDRLVRLRTEARGHINALDRAIGRARAKARRLGRAELVRDLDAFYDRWVQAADELERRLTDPSFDRQELDDFVAAWEPEVEHKVSDVP
jgi:CheY-like chemotaxis protein